MMISGTRSNSGGLSGIIASITPLKGSISVSVKNVPYYETSNEQGGTTVYIGKEVPNNGVQ